MDAKQPRIDTNEIENYDLTQELQISKTQLSKQSKKRKQHNKHNENTSDEIATLSLPWTEKKRLLFMLYIAPRGIINIYHLSIKQKLGQMSFSTNGKLIYVLNNSTALVKSSLFFCDYGSQSRSIVNHHAKKHSSKSLSDLDASDNDNDNYDNDDLDGVHSQSSNNLNRQFVNGIMYQITIQVTRDYRSKKHRKRKKMMNNKQKDNDKIHGLSTIPESMTRSHSNKSLNSNPACLDSITFVYPKGRNNFGNSKQEEKTDSYQRAMKKKSDDNVCTPYSEFLLLYLCCVLFCFVEFGSGLHVNWKWMVFFVCM